MKRLLVTLPIFLGIILLAIPTQAHRAWILPAATILSGDDPWVSFDAAISNDIFHPDHRAMNLVGISAMSPSGKMIELQNPHTGKFRSNFDLSLKEQGTYKIYAASSGISASWENENGERRRWPGRGREANMDEFDSMVPKKARNLKITQGSRRLETFVTSGAPNKKVLAPTMQGLELDPITHPNDLYAEETASFRLLIDGKPAVGAEVSVLPGGMRYRDGQDEIKVTSNAEGLINITWPRAGMYFLEAEYSDDQAKAPATTRRGSYVATFEVLPQ